MKVLLQLTKVELESAAVYADNFAVLLNTMGLTAQITHMEKLQLFFGRTVTKHHGVMTYTISRDALEVSFDLSEDLVVDYFTLLADLVSEFTPAAVGIIHVIKTFVPLIESRMELFVIKHQGELS